MKKLSWILLLMLLITSCNAAPAGTQAWFDKPLPGTKYAFSVIKPIELIMHGTDPQKINQMEVFANGVSFAVLQGSGGSGQFAQFTTQWLPPAPGKYLLTARAQGSGGWSDFATTVVIVTNLPMVDRPSATDELSREFTPLVTMTLDMTPSVTPTGSLVPPRDLSPTPTLFPTRFFTATNTPIPTRELPPENTPLPTRVIPPTETPIPTREVPTAVPPEPTREPPPADTPEPTRDTRPLPTPTPGRQ